MGIYIKIVSLSLLIFGVICFLYFNDPNLPDSNTPDCLFYKTTSLRCPGCGMTRAVYALIHFDAKGVLSQNIFGILFIPFLIFSYKSRKISYSRWYPIFLFILLLIVTVLKNL